MALLNLSCGSVFLVLRGGTELPPPLSPAAQSLPSERSGGSNLLAAGICARSRSRCCRERHDGTSCRPSARGTRLPVPGDPDGCGASQAKLRLGLCGCGGSARPMVPSSFASLWVIEALALYPMNSLSPRPPWRKSHPPVSPCAAGAAPSFVTLLREALSERACAVCVQAEPPPPCEGFSDGKKCMRCAHLARHRRTPMCSGLGSG